MKYLSWKRKENLFVLSRLHFFLSMVNLAKRSEWMQDRWDSAFVDFTPFNFFPHVLQMTKVDSTTKKFQIGEFLQHLFPWTKRKTLTGQWRQESLSRSPVPTKPGGIRIKKYPFTFNWLFYSLKLQLHSQLNSSNDNLLVANRYRHGKKSHIAAENLKDKHWIFNYSRLLLCARRMPKHRSLSHPARYCHLRYFILDRLYSQLPLLRGTSQKMFAMFPPLDVMMIHHALVPYFGLVL